MLKADEGPLDVEDVVTDHIGFAVFDQKLEVVHCLQDVFVMQHITDQTQVDIGYKEPRTQNESSPAT